MRRAVYPRQRAKRWVATTSLVAEMYNRNTQQKSQREEVTSQRQNHQTVSLKKDVNMLCFSLDSNMDGRGAGRKAPRNPTANLRRQLTRWRSKKPAAISAVYTNQCPMRNQAVHPERKTLRLS